jgi:sulfatase maturation enzyme AslB (radical SAM superfamily)
MQQVKADMLAGVPVKQCATCYTAEATWNYSMRTDFNRKHEKELADIVNTNQLRTIELHLGNYCNLKCLMCFSQDSSAMLTENIELKLDTTPQQYFTFDNNTFDAMFESIEKHIDQIEVLDLRGGETMIIPQVKQWLTAIDPEVAKRLTIKIQSNGTVFNESWRNIFLKFKTVELALSVDAFGALNEYIRFPGNWQQFNDNLQKFKSIDTVQLAINSTISNLNWLRVEQLLDWYAKDDNTFHLAVLHSPNYHLFTNLPKPLLARHLPIIKQYSHRFNNEITTNQIHELIATVENYLDNAVEDTALWLEFCRVITLRDAYRGNSIFDQLPELKDYWVE